MAAKELSAMLTWAAALCLYRECAGACLLPALAAIGKAKHLLVGSAADAYLLPGGSAVDWQYVETLRYQYAIITPENAMKWQPTQPTRGCFDFSSADRIVDFAREHDMIVRGHNLVWHNQLPNWLCSKKDKGYGCQESELSDKELRYEMKRRIHTMTSRYDGDVVVAWDVVNEAIADNTRDAVEGGLRRMLWSTRFGEEFLDFAFLEAAQSAASSVKLFYNDYGAEVPGAKADRVFNLIERMLQRQVPVHGIGFQMHVRAVDSLYDDIYESASTEMETEKFVSETLLDGLKSNMERFAALGLDIHITEMDVDVSRLNCSENERYDRQAGIYQKVMASCLSVKRCTSFLSWGFTDKYSWLSRRSGADPLVFDRGMLPKPAFWALIEELQSLTLLENSSFNLSAEI